MKKVVLVFPDISRLSSFILTEKIGGLEVKSSELKVTGMLTEKQIEKASTEYKAELVKREDSMSKN